MSRQRAPLPAVRAAFVDASAWFALANQQDVDHPALEALVEELLAVGTRLLTTNFVLAEAHVLILARTRRSDRAVAFLNDAYASKYLTVVRVTAADEQTALAILNRYDDKAFSFTDAISFAVMERLAISHALTLDRNFAQYGWTMLGPTSRA